MEYLNDALSLVVNYVGNLRYPATRWYFIASCVVLTALSYFHYFPKTRGLSPIGRPATP